jgi:hexokinase
MSQLKRKYVNQEIIEATKPKVKSEDQAKIQQICSDLHISNDQAHIVERRMRLAIEQGLSKEKHEKSSIKCFPTYVRHLPSGKEQGRYLALDLGGTNFRVLLVELFGRYFVTASYCLQLNCSIDNGAKFIFICPFSREKEPSILSKKFPVPENIMVSQGNVLFDYIAESIANFLLENGIQDECLPIGFTFSFPCEQMGLDSAKLTKWTKGFNCPDVVGKDICESLKEALSKRDEIKVNVSALLNDSTGCLLSCSWREPRCRIGLIVGTGKYSYIHTSSLNTPRKI